MLLKKEKKETQPKIRMCRKRRKDAVAESEQVANVLGQGVGAAVSVP